MECGQCGTASGIAEVEVGGRRNKVLAKVSKSLCFSSH